MRKKRVTASIDTVFLAPNIFMNMPNLTHNRAERKRDIGKGLDLWKQNIMTGFPYFRASIVN